MFSLLFRDLNVSIILNQKYSETKQQTKRLLSFDHAFTLHYPSLLVHRLQGITYKKQKE